jgi:hypothetical protein
VRHGGLLLAALVSLPLFSAITTPTSPVSAQDPRQVALGVSLKAYTSMSALDAITASIGGEQPAIWSIWSDWQGANRAFPASTAQALKSRGVTPMIFWQPDDPNHPNLPVVTYSKILAGQFDDYIRTWASAAKAYGNTVLVRFAHEMNGDWFPWGVNRFDNTPALFLAAWQYIVNIFRGPSGVGADNVKFVWSPYTPVKALYPGDQYVDYVGFTAFNWGQTQGWRTMKTVYSYAVEAARGFTNKPMIAAETGSTSIGGDKANWITEGYQAVYRAYPEVVGIVYFDINTLPGQVDWRLTTPAGALTAYQAIAADWRFQGSLEPPTASLTGVPKVTNKSSTPLTISASSPTGRAITGYYVSTAGKAPTSASNWKATPPTSLQFGATDGEKTIYVWARDASGAISSAATARVNVDRTAPIANINILPAAVNHRAVSIKVTGNGTGSQINGYIVRQGGSAPGPHDAAWRSTPPAGFDLVGTNGTMTLQAWVRDRAGNVSAAATDQVIYDTVPPALTLSAPAQTVGRRVSITLTASDDRSGVARYYLSQSSIKPSETTSGWLSSMPTTWSLSGAAGTKELYAWVRDAAGNISTKASATIGLQLGPAVSLTTAALTKSPSIHIALSASDPRGNQITGYYLSESPTDPTASSAWLSSAPTSTTLSAGDGPKTLYAWAMADDGVISQDAWANVLLDTTPPTIGVQLPATSGSLTVPLTISAQDAGSGVGAYFASESSTPPTINATGWAKSVPQSFAFSPGDGQRSLYVWAKDKAGNLSSAATAQVTISVPLTTYISDDFNRTVASGLGTAPTGGTYDSAGGTFSVNGSQGLIQTAPGTSAWALLDRSPSPNARDVQVGITFGVQAIPTGSSSEWLYLAERSTTSGEYRLKVRIDTYGKLYLGMSRVVNGAETDIATEVAVSGMTATVGHSYRLLGQVDGSPATLRLRLWDLAGSDPGTWQLVSSPDSTAALQGAGSMGLRTYVSSHVAATQALLIDDYTVTDVP